MDILYLVDRLENLIASSRRMPLVNQIILKEAEVLSIIDLMRTSIPDEVKQARRIIQEKERILAQAQADATTIQARAREESERALNREGLLQAAEERSQEIIRRATEQGQLIVRRAEERTEQLKIEADGYASETLRNLREHLLSIETEVGRTILSIERGLDSLHQGAEEEQNEGEKIIRTSQEKTSPRRAALAADTMGAGPAYE
jgi:hypothetical protein